MDVNQHDHLLYKIIAIDRSFNIASLRKTHQDTLRVIARLVTELHDTQEELKELKKSMEGNNMRHLVDVINQILEVSTNEELNKRLEKIKYDCGFTAPELMHMRWDSTAKALNEHVYNPVESEETIKIVSIFTTLSREEVKERFSKINFKKDE